MSTNAELLLDLEHGANLLLSDRLDYATRHSNWYRKRKRRNQIASMAVRLLAIPSLLAGGLCPILGSVFAVDLLPLGYVALGVGGALLLVDTLLGLSSNWQRFMRTALEIEAAAEIFRLKWLRLTLEQSLASQFLELAERFTHEVDQRVISETAIWESERDEMSKLAKGLASAKK